MNLKAFHKTTFARYFTLLLLSFLCTTNVWGQQYELVTSAPTDWSGTYLFAYVNGTSAYVYNGTDAGANNGVSATISNNAITFADGMTKIEVASISGGYSLKIIGGTNDGKYLSGGTSNGTTFGTTAVANSLSMNSDGTVKINNNTTTSFQFNSASDQQRFRYFKSSQKSIKLFKEGGTPTPSKTLTSIAISGTPTKTTYDAGEEFNPAGLAVTGTYDDKSSAQITSGITWTVTPSPLTVGTTSVSVTAQVRDIKSPAYTVNGLTVNAASRWEKVTSAPDDWTGEYLLVYESNETAYVWTGVDDANCYASATISNNQISKPSDAVILSVVAMKGGYSILVNGGTNKGKYISGKSDKNTIIFTDDEQLNTFSYSDNGITIKSNTSTIQYNSDSGQQRFRYYKSGSNQKPVQLYRIASSDPHISATPTSIAFDLQELKGTATDSKEIEVTGHNLTSAISAKMKSGSSSIFSCSGTLTKDGGTLTISYTTNTAGKYDDIVVLSSTGAKDVEIPVSVEIVNHIPILQSIYIKGTPTQTTYEVGDAFKTDGLEVWGKYDEGADKQITEGIEWTVDPEIFTTAGTVSVDVMANIGEELISDVFIVNNITVKAPEGDKLTPNEVGNPDTYAQWKYVGTYASYIGFSTGGNTKFQLRSKDNESGIVSTTSGGNIKKIKVDWETTPADSKGLKVYGSHQAYTATSDLYGDNKGTEIGSILGSAKELEIFDEYEYVGVRSVDGAVYLNSISFVWEDPKTLKSIAISGTPTKTTYEAGEEFDPTGLVVTGTYDDGSKADVTARASWSFNPSTLSVGTTSVSVTATVGEKSDTQTVSGLTVNAAPQKVKFDFATNLYGHKGVSSGSDNHDGDLVDNEVFTEVPVDITFSQNPNKTTTRFWDNKGKIELRIYEGSSFTIKSDGNKITKVEFAGTVNLTANESPVEDKTWTGKQSIVTFVNTDKGSSALTSITVYYEEAAPSVSDPTITPSVDAETYWEPFTVTLACAISGASIYYTTDGTDPTTTSTKYSKPFQVSETIVVKAIATKSGLDDSNIVSKKFTFGQIFNSLEELVAADLKSGTIVKVSFENVPIKNIYVTEAGYRNGIFFDIQKEGNDIELYYQNVPMDWVVGGFVSGTITCPWKTYNKTWELAPENKTWDWNNLTYTAPASVTAKITSTGYATFSSNAALDLSKLPAGLTAYKGVVNGNRISLTPVTTAVPASTGLFLKGTAGATYSIPVAQGNPTALADNCFLPTTGGKLTKGSLVYVIAKNEFEALDKDLVVSLGKAYIANASDVKALSLFFDEADGINSISTSSMMNTQVFNLSGQKVDNSFKGIVIINGKKVLKK